jgi:hypothetical protein
MSVSSPALSETLSGWLISIRDFFFPPHVSPNPSPAELANNVGQANAQANSLDDDSICYTCTRNPLNIKLSVPFQKGEIYGTIYFNIGGSEKILEARAGKQCPELIYRYGRMFGLDIKPTGDGWEAAGKLATGSQGKFVYREAGKATNPPLIGSVISINKLATDKEIDELRKEGKEMPATPKYYGHTGIIQDAKWDPHPDVVKAIMFDQNVGHSTADPYGQGWKTVTFKKSQDGTWSGTWTNNGQPYPVTGWADPNSAP